MKRVGHAVLLAGLLLACGSHRTAPRSDGATGVIESNEPATMAAAAVAVPQVTTAGELAAAQTALTAPPGPLNAQGHAALPAPTARPIVSPTTAPTIPGSITASWPPGVAMPPRSVAAPTDLLAMYALAPVLPAPILGPNDTMPVLSTGAGMYFTTPPSLGATPWTIAANAGSSALGWLAVYVKAPGDTRFQLHDAVPVSGQRVHGVPVKSFQPTAPGIYWFFAIGGDAAGGIQNPKLASIQGAEYRPGQQIGAEVH